MRKNYLSRKKLRKHKRKLITMLAALMITQPVLTATASVPAVTADLAATWSPEEEDAPEEVDAEETDAETKDVKEETVEEVDAETEDAKEVDAEEVDAEEEADQKAGKDANADSTDESSDDTDVDDSDDTDVDEGEGLKDEELTDDVTDEGDLASASNATPDDTKVDIFEDMPKIGTDSFTEWFFSHVDSEDLWEWAFELLSTDDDMDDDFVAFLEWYVANETRFLEAYKVYASSLGLDIFMVRASSTGDLWTNWIGNTTWSGDGTESHPYEIDDIADLCGLTEMVAAGNSFEGEYFRLTQDIDLGSLDKSWNPIGWYQNKTELGGAVSHKFKGNFDGDDCTISGIKVKSTTNTLNNIGLFGSIDGGSIKNLTVSAEGITGGDNVGVLAGSISGDTIVYNVKIEDSYLSATGDAGGIAGEVTGAKNAKSGTVTIEDCEADGIKIQSSGGYIGGIVGNAQNCNLVDISVRTYDGSADRIQGQGYVGGIVGRQNATNIYNSYVSGTIGGNGSTAIGGIVGKYQSGNLIVARFEGTIGNSNNGTASREGTFIGTRDASNSFTYGTGKNDNFAYLFTTSASMAKKVVGSGIDNDNSFTLAANVGYWESNERKYHLVAGSVDKEISDLFFFEALEAGIKHIVVMKLGNTFSKDEYWDGCDFKINHFAPNSYGAPIRGYLVSIPRIDTRNANGSYDSDVATLTAIGKTSNSYYKTIDKDNPSAVAVGDVIEVGTSANNKNGNRYQMVYDAMQPGKVKPPTYTDEDGSTIYMNYITGGTYSFTMPEADTELNVDYIKVTTQLTMTPAETTLKVVQTRDGDRKNPTITTVVYNNEGVQIAKYIGSISQVTPTPITVHAEHNGEGNANDKTVKWSVDNENLITMTNVDLTSYTDKDAYIMPNLSSSFITNLINTRVQAQVDSQYAEAIDNTIYSDVAVVTATTNPATSVNNEAVVGNTRVNVTFQIVDNTTRRVEGLNLNYADVTYTVTRRLSGDRTNPVETITCSQPTVLAATLYPIQPFNKNVTWKDEQSGSIITLTPSGNYTENCSVGIRYDAEGKSNPAWIQNVINQDNEKRANDKYAKLSGTSSYKEVVTSTSEDQTHGVVSAKCNVVINFVTVDETVIHPESISMNQAKVDYDLAFIMTGDAKSSVANRTGFTTVDLDCTVNPDLTVEAIHEPYNRSVTWSVSDSDALKVDQEGNITPNKDAQWIKDAMLLAPYTATKTVTVYATAKDNGVVGSTAVTLNFTAHCVEFPKDTLTFDIALTKTGSRSNPTLAWGGADAVAFAAAAHPDNTKTVAYSSNNEAIVTIASNGTVTPVLDVTSDWMKAAMTSPYTSSTTVTVNVTDGKSTDTCVITLNLKVTDKTSSGSSSGGGGGGGGGSSSGTKSTGATTTVGGPSASGSVTGTWTKLEDGRGGWTFSTTERAYAGEWAYIYNPFADTAAGQRAYDWFRFDADGYMVTGWYTDTDGNVYYLNPLEDNFHGYMITGWYWIKGTDGKERCYYFKEAADGTGGSLVRSTTIDGNTVNENGEWTVNGIVQIF